MDHVPINGLDVTMTSNLRVAAIAPLILALFGACVGADDDSRGPELTVEMRLIKGDCAVRGVEMKCDDVPRYLRDTLKIALDTYIAVSIPPESATFESTSPVIKALNAAGYRTVIGSIEIDNRAPRD